MNGDLEEIILSEADQLLNAQLLEDAKKASVQSRHRGRKPFRRGSASGKHNLELCKPRNSCVICREMQFFGGDCL